LTRFDTGESLEEFMLPGLDTCGCLSTLPHFGPGKFSLLRVVAAFPAEGSTASIETDNDDHALVTQTLEALAQDTKETNRKADVIEDLIPQDCQKRRPDFMVGSANG
jgi:hypothetical protein